MIESVTSNQKPETRNQKPVTRMTIREFEFDFERLIVYQKTLMLIDKIFEIYKQFSSDYKIAIGSNLIRAGLSVANNIAEGNGKESEKEKKRYFSISLDSVKECVSIFNVLYRQKLVNEDKHKEIRKDCREISSMIIGLIKINLK